MNSFIENLTAEFKRKEDKEIAIQQKAYLRNQFEFYGIKTTSRRTLQKPFFVKEYLPPKSILNSMVKLLWSKPQREYHYFGQELAFKYVKTHSLEDISLYEFMVSNKSWWDTVDFIAVKLMGSYFKKFPEQREFYVKKWLESNNMWLQRSALLFQLKYKREIDTVLLHSTIHSLLGSNEFFINKAIGWILREYSRTNPEWVVEFAKNTPLHNLSKREALRLIIKKTPINQN